MSEQAEHMNAVITKANYDGDGVMVSKQAYIPALFPRLLTMCQGSLKVRTSKGLRPGMGWDGMGCKKGHPFKRFGFV